MNTLEIEASINNWETVLAFIENTLEAIDCPVSVQNKICIAAEEIFINIAHYAYKTKGIASIGVTARNEVTISFEDEGIPFDPLSKLDPNIRLTADEREIGGLGIFMAKHLMDDITYRYEGNKNILTIRKELTP